MLKAISLKEVSNLNWAPVVPFNKYHNHKTEYDGVLYHSKKEADYAASLNLCMKAKQKANKVISWERQIPFKMIIKKTLICTYYLDFKVVYADGRTEYIDVKGGEATKTDVYIIKKKLLKALHGIDLKEV